MRAETPADFTSKLAAALQKVFAQDATKEFLKRAKVELMALPPVAQEKFQRAEIDRLRRLADAAGIKPE